MRAGYEIGEFEVVATRNPDTQRINALTVRIRKQSNTFGHVTYVLELTLKCSEAGMCTFKPVESSVSENKVAMLNDGEETGPFTNIKDVVAVHLASEEVGRLKVADLMKVKKGSTFFLTVPGGKKHRIFMLVAMLLAKATFMAQPAVQ